MNNKVSLFSALEVLKRLLIYGISSGCFFLCGGMSADLYDPRYVLLKPPESNVRQEKLIKKMSSDRVDQKGLCNVNLQGIHERMDDHHEELKDLKYMFIGAGVVILVFIIVFVIMQRIKNQQKKKYERKLREVVKNDQK